MKRISFIITYYNEPLQQLQECVQSVLRLPLVPEEREILLIDDGSTVPAGYATELYPGAAFRLLRDDDSLLMKVELFNIN